MRGIKGVLKTVVAALAVYASCFTAVASAEVPLPTIEGPITGPGNAFVAGTTFDLAEVGYVAEEFFISGTARSYTSADPLGVDGRWDVSEAVATAAYKTRIIVHRPVESKRFKGGVVVEWLNVSGGLDAAPDWIAAHTEMVRSGVTWVGVSAQFVGVEGGGGGLVDLALKSVNPARYGSLVHPGDTFSYDIFSQAGAIIAGPAAPTVLGGETPNRVIAAGESQSAFRLVTYVNAIHPIVDVFDGFFIHSRGGGGASLSQGPQPVVGVPGGTLIRTDLNVPVLTFQTETDVTLLGSFSARQTDTGFLRFWEIAGTAHADLYTLIDGLTDRGNDPSVLEVVENSAPIPGIITCADPVNAGHQHHFAVKAALVALDRWVRGKKPPPKSPLIETTSSGGPPVIVRDGFGNALGGIRSPWVDVPIATLSGEGQTGGAFCFLFGTTQLFDGPTLTSLYGDQRSYAKAVKRSAREMRKNGFLLRSDNRLLRKYLRGAAIVP